MLTGGNGLLTKAADARVDNYRGEVCDRINTAINACYAEILSHQYGVGDDLLKESAGTTISKDNGLDSAKIGKYTVTATTTSIDITWDNNGNNDYGEPITGKIEKKGSGKVPYVVTPAVIREADAAEATTSATPGG